MTPPAPLRLGVAIALTAAAGFVDALGWLALHRVFTAQMSGNTVLIAVHASAGETGAAILQAFTVGMFFLGILIAGAVIEIGLRLRIRRVFAVAMALELCLLGSFAGFGPALIAAGLGTHATPGWPLFLLVALAATAMGAQNTSLRMAGILGIYTTHVTGTLTRLSEDLIAYGFTVVDRLAAYRGGLASRSLRAREPASLGKMGLSAGLLLGFFGGALVAAQLVPRWGVATALLLPIAVVAAVGALDLLAPLGADKRERQKRGG